MPARIATDRARLGALGDDDLSAVPDFSFDGCVRAARIVRVVDGDTVWLAMMHEGEPRRFKVRLAGIDAPEMRPLRSEPERDAIKREARAASDALAALLPVGAACTIECGAFGKYGRILATLRTADGVCANDYLVERGYAVRNGDGGRTLWTDMWPALQQQRASFRARAAEAIHSGATDAASAAAPLPMGRGERSTDNRRNGLSMRALRAYCCCCCCWGRK